MGLIVHVCPPSASTQFDYYNSLLINSVDEDGSSLELGAEFPLEENEHFNNLPVNTQQSNIQIPTNVFNRGPLSVSTATAGTQRSVCV